MIARQPPGEVVDGIEVRKYLRLETGEPIVGVLSYGARSNRLDAGSSALFPVEITLEWSRLGNQGQHIPRR
jgi:hypothetical protein